MAACVRALRQHLRRRTGLGHPAGRVALPAGIGLVALTLVAAGATVPASDARARWEAAPVPVVSTPPPTIVPPVGEVTVTPTPPPPADVADESLDAGDVTPTPEPPVRPRPRRQYAVPVVSRPAAWPFGPDVYRWQTLVEQELAQVGATRRLSPALTPELVLSVIAAESLGDPTVVSYEDAVGLMQVLPTTFQDLLGDGDPFDPELNVQAGIIYLNMALAGQDGDVEWALASYHAGIGAATRARASEDDLFDDTLDYVETVIDLRDAALQFRGVAPPSPPAPVSVREWLRPAEEQIVSASIGGDPEATPEVVGAQATPATGADAAASPGAGLAAAPSTGTGDTLADSSPIPLVVASGTQPVPSTPPPSPSRPTAPASPAASGSPTVSASATRAATPSAAVSGTPSPTPEATRTSTATAAKGIATPSQPSPAATATPPPATPTLAAGGSGR